MANNYNSFEPYDRPFTLNGDIFILGRECDSDGDSGEVCAFIEMPVVTITLTEPPYETN